MELRHFLREYMGWYSVSYVTNNIFLNTLASRHSVGVHCAVGRNCANCVGRVEPIAGGTHSPSSGIGAGEVKKRRDYRGQITEDRLQWTDCRGRILRDGL